MPPLRRYLRITKYSVLECRIYLDNPTELHRWLLNTTTPVLPRIIEAVRPLVLPKLREENARAKSGKGGKKKGWKDVVVEDDFEVAVFLTEVSSRHAILRKDKILPTEKPRLGTTTGTMATAGTMDIPVEVEDGEDVQVAVDEDLEGHVNLDEIPMANDDETGGDLNPGGRQKERGVTVPDDSGDESTQRQSMPRLKEGHRPPMPIALERQENDKKKIAIKTTYDGFSIHGRILCLVVKRKGIAGRGLVGGTGQAMMEEWIASTQMADGQTLDG